jgi:hypothetical protein
MLSALPVVALPHHTTQPQLRTDFSNALYEIRIYLKYIFRLLFVRGAQKASSLRHFLAGHKT